MQLDRTDDRHFTRAVAQLGEKRPVVARSAIFNAQGLKIIDKGVAIDSRLYDRLTQHQLRTPLDECVECEPGVSGALLREEAQALCREDRFCAAMLAQLREPDVLLDELLVLPLPRPVAFQLTVLREMQPALWQHSLRSMITAAWLAERLGGTRYDMRMLAAGGLLHDLGSLHLDPALLEPETQLGRAQRRQLYTHPLISVMLLERHHVYPKELLQAVLEHHEALDGSGYPRNLGAEQSLWGRVLALCELVTGMTGSGRDAPALRLSLALRMNAPRFDREATAVVMEWLRPLREALPESVARDPVPALGEIDRLLQGWSAVASSMADPGPARQSALQRISDLCEAARTALARSGAAPGQLAILGAEAADSAVAGELALIARESAWQLRAVARQARRRWRLAPGETYPAPLQAWLDEVDALCVRALGS